MQGREMQHRGVEGLMKCREVAGQHNCGWQHGSDVPGAGAAQLGSKARQTSSICWEVNK